MFTEHSAGKDLFICISIFVYAKSYLVTWGSTGEGPNRRELFQASLTMCLL